MSSLKPYQMLIDGKLVDAEGGKTFASLNPATGQPWAMIPGASDGDVDRAVRAAHRAFTQGPWREPPRRSAASICAGSPTSSPIGPRNRPDRDHRHRQAAQGDPLAGELRRRLLQLLRRARRQDRGRDPADRQARHVRPDLPRAARRRRRHHSVELADVPERDQDRARPCRRQHDRAQGLRGRAGPAARVRQAGARGRHSRGRRQYRDRVRRALRAGAHHPSARRAHRLHRRARRRAISSAIRPRTSRSSRSSSAASRRSWCSRMPISRVRPTASSPASSARAARPASPDPGSICRRRWPTGAGRARRPRAADPHRRSAGRGDPDGSARHPGQLTGIEAAMDEARRDKARILHGGSRPAHLNAGWYYEPTIVDCENGDHAIAEKELFGPVLCAFRFKDEEEIVAKANDTRFGLAAGDLHARCRPRAPHLAGDARRHHLGQHLSHGVADRRVRRHEGQRLRAGERRAGDLRLHLLQGGLDQHLDQADRQSVRDALSDQRASFNRFECEREQQTVIHLFEALISSSNTTSR